jgi:hypothetical protein
MAATLFAGQNVGLSDENHAGAELKRTTGEITLCRGWRSSRFEISPCVGLALEHITARGFGDGVASSAQRSTWLAPSVSAVLHVHATPMVALFASIGAYFESSRPRIVIEGLGQVTQLGSFAAGALAGLEWTF